MVVARTAAAALARLADAVPPLTPDGDEARKWAERELAEPEYAAAQPTPLDRIGQAIGDFLGRLFGTELSGGWGPWVAVIAAIVVAIVIVVSFAIWGRPRLSRRMAGATALFGATEQRSAAELRRDAASHVANAEWSQAIVLRFRALARGLDERGLVDVPPGATVHAFARTAGRALPAIAESVDSAASAFEDVRYLRRAGTPELYRRVAEADDAAVAARPPSGVLTGAPS